MPEIRDRIDPAHVTRVRCLVPDLHQTVQLELGQRPVDPGAVHVAQAEIGNGVGECVAMPGLLRQKEQHGRMEELASRPVLGDGVTVVGGSGLLVR